MSLPLSESLAKLERLSPQKLHQTSCRIRSELGGAEWKMGVCLLASVRQGTFRKLGYANITEYAERGLQMSGKKAGCLLGATRALEHLPVLSEAFRNGQIGWGKLRAISGLVTPETEEQWLDYARSHRTDQVVRKASLSPASWKRYRALQASLDAQPIAEPEAVTGLLARPDGADGLTDRASQPVEHPNPPAHQTVAAKVSTNVTTTTYTLPSPPQTIRLVIELTPDQYAVYERAESRVRAKARRRLSRATVITQMAEAILDAGTARSRAKHQVLIHATDQQAWYDTERGLLPVAPEVLEEALRNRAPLSTTPPGELAADKTNLGERTQTLSISLPHPERPDPEIASDIARNSKDQECKNKTKRKSIPNGTLRRLFAQAGHRCQRCGTQGGPLDAHHTQPVSEGGDNRITKLRVLCRSCHALDHEEDFATKPSWQRARKAAMERGP